eukprot:COSAG06_NODE_2074_length_7656_cov_11.758237_1_plen_61_part_00
MTPNPRPWWRLNTTLTCETGCGELLGVGAFWGLMVAVAVVVWSSLCCLRTQSAAPRRFTR